MNSAFSVKQRGQWWNEVTNESVDVIIIGGGITGCGIALDSASRGIQTVLFEMNDFASGTSSRSTKLVHGGLRYLKQFQVGVVAETGKERAIVYENGPHVTSPEWMVLPFYEGGTFGAFSTSIGLRVYDFLAGVKKSERRKMFDIETTLEREPLLNRKGLKGSGYYVEYRTDDARLTIEVGKKAVEQGAKLFNYAKVEEFLYDETGKVKGVRVKDQLTNEVYEVHGSVIVNATGPWVDKLREKDKSRNGKVLQLSKGVHLVFDQERFPLRQAIYFDTSDGRMIFAIPRDGKTYVGTTDTFYKEKEIAPRMTEEDRKYILNETNGMFPTLSLTEKDVESSWAGVRPLIFEEGKNASEISRKDEIWTSHSGLITIAGGKLTGYRHMAENVVNLVAEKMNRPFAPCSTKGMPISGGDVNGSDGFTSYIKEKVKQGIKIGYTEEQCEKMVRFYGSNVDTLYSYYDEGINRTLSVDDYCELMYALDYEMVVTPVDYVMRRKGASLFNVKWAHGYKEEVLEIMAEYFNWSQQELEKNRVLLDEHLNECITPGVESQS